MRSNLLKIFFVFLILTLLMTSCEFSTSKISSIELEKHLTNAKIGDEIELTVRSSKDKVIDPSQFFWQSSDYSVAVVNANGSIRCISSGPAVITATLKDDMTITASTEIFVEYETEAHSSPIFTKTGTYVNAEFGKIGDLLLDFNFNIIDAVTAASLPLDIVLGFFSSEQYLFSMLYYRGNYQNVVICPLTDWTNMDQPAKTHLITPDYIHEQMIKELEITGYLTGSTFEVYIEDILAFLDDTLPDDKTYYFSKMSADMQYRAVLLGNFDHLTNVSHYSNGLLTALGITIDDLLNKDLASLPSNFYDQKLYDEIINLSNLRICIECREISK